MFSQSMFQPHAKSTYTPAQQNILDDLSKINQFYKNVFEVKFVINLLTEALRAKKPLNGNALRQAAILDTLKPDLQLVKRLLELGATYTKETIKEIKLINKNAAHLLEKHLSIKAKL